LRSYRWRRFYEWDYFGGASWGRSAGRDIHDSGEDLATEGLDDAAANRQRRIGGLTRQADFQKTTEDL